MKKFFSILTVVFLFAFSLIGSACSNESTNNYINLNVYFGDSVEVVTENGNKTSIKVDSLVGDKEQALSRYNQYILKGIPKWTYDLYIESIEFEIVANEKATFDMEIIITNIIKSDTAEYTADLLWHFYHAFHFESNPDTPYKTVIEVNEQFNNLSGEISFVVDKYSTLLESSTLKYTIDNLKIKAYHI